MEGNERMQEMNGVGELNFVELKLLFSVVRGL